MYNAVTLTGFKEFSAKLHNLPAVLKKEVNVVAQDAAGLWEQRAKQDAPKDQGALAQSISSRQLALGKWEVVSPKEYSAFVEFGTKTRVQVPPDLQQYAQQFRGGTGAGNAKKMIYAWMDRVGIPKKAQWFVFISIIVKGIHPHPYFFIQRPHVQKQLEADLKAIIKKPR